MAIRLLKLLLLLLLPQSGGRRLLFPAQVSRQTRSAPSGGHAVVEHALRRLRVLFKRYAAKTAHALRRGQLARRHGSQGLEVRIVTSQ